MRKDARFQRAFTQRVQNQRRFKKTTSRKRILNKRTFRNRRIVSVSGYRKQGTVLLFLFLFLFPYVVSFFFDSGGEETAETAQEVASQEKAGVFSERYQESYKESRFIVCNTTGAGTERMPMETYLIARLPATVPVEYEPEALKAQAVVLRTELMKLYYDGLEEAGGKEREVSSDGHIYLYTEGKLCISHGEAYEKCRNAVETTRGMYLTFNGAPVKAPYFAVSAGATRNGNETLQSDQYPYLKSVMCPRDFTAESYAQSVRMDETAFTRRFYGLLAQKEGVGETLSLDALTLSRDRAGYVLTVEAGENAVSGEAFREAFMLSSSCFTLERQESFVVLRTKGVGHGLGLCQYAANEAAKKGSDFIDILNYFFTGIALEKTE